MEALAQEMAQLLDRLGDEDREALRTHVAEVLREQRGDDEPTLEKPNTPTPTKVFNPLGIGIPILLMGGVLLVIFPPVGLLLVAIAVMLVIWGVLATLFTKSSAEER